MKKFPAGLWPVLLLVVAAPAAERLKTPLGPEDLEYFTKNRAARISHWEHPQYAPERGADWVQQTVRVAFEVDPSGNVLDARSMGGAEKFEAAAVAAVARWKFEPEIVDGQPALATKEVRMTFTPRGTPKRTAQDEYQCPYPMETPHEIPPGDPASNEAIYPASLLPRRLSGEVELMVSVDREGRVDGVKILRATHPEFLGAALQTVGSWQLKPARRGKVPQPGQKRAVLTFQPVDDEGRLNRTEWLERNGIFLRAEADKGTTALFDHTPTAVAMVDPVYPRELLYAGTRGAARVDFSVGLDGRVSGVRVAEATAPEFGEALAAAIAAWRFESLERGGRPSGGEFSITWRFNEPAADSAEQRILANRGTDLAAVGARQLDRPLFPLFTLAPVYPAGRLETGEAGSAEIEVIIDRHGRVRLPHVRAASHPEFGWAAATAVTQWLFETPRRNGEPVDVRVVIPLNFQGSSANDGPPAVGT